MPTPAVLNGTYQYQYRQSTSECSSTIEVIASGYFASSALHCMHDIKSRLQQPASEAARRLTKSNQASRTNNLPAYLKTKLKENTGDSELATHPCR
ncbi:hypothetical protein COCOBI_19-1060 [Coccomyxa sp. Obi]|nr:hypothetical protein COCOBI_15-2180 [Coccomyxa sp. Obi]BDA51550.1 hypothetical protein COCOBI_19-1060 [Coccomyxa sp. Obi]